MKNKSKDIWIPLFLVLAMLELSKEERDAIINGNEELLEKLRKENRNESM